MDFDPLDEYLSSSSSTLSSGEDMDVGGGSASSNDRTIETGCGSRSPSRGKTAGGSRPAGKVAAPISLRVSPTAALGEPSEVEPEDSSKLRRELRGWKKHFRQRRREMTQRRREFNAITLAREEQEREIGVTAAAAAAATAAAEELRKRPGQVDLSKLAHFRYSRGTLALGSEEDWVSDGLYEGSSTAATEISPEELFPPEFYGSGARPRFYDLYRLVHRQKQTVDDDEVLEEEEFTPRRRFLRDTLARGITPAPTMMRSRKDPYTLDLGFQGLGDMIGLSLATSLPFLPNLTSLKLRENRLTDVSLNNILAEAVRLERLTSLDLSSNKIDHSALVLREYLASISCALQSLSLSNADVDDDECNSLMEALAGNVSVKALDLSHNMIGDKETYNFVRPDYTTGGEAIAEMLVTNITLSRLDLSWNSVRMASGVSLGHSLAHNSALTELKLAHNSLADPGVQAIAQSLRSNGALRLLDISFNNMKPRSAMVLANALLDNSSLDRLIMSHNNVGRRGARAVFMALRQRARNGVELLVDLQSCELGSETGDDLFDMYNPSGRYELDMAKPYDYMVARMLLAMANKSEGLEFTNVEHASGERGAWKPLVLARRTQTLTTSSSKRNSENGGGGDNFGENTLGIGVSGRNGRDWRRPAGALLKYCRFAGGETVEQAQQEEVENFFHELGLEPTTTISRKICDAFNAARLAEREAEGEHDGEGGSSSDTTENPSHPGDGRAPEEGQGGRGDTVKLASGSPDRHRLTPRISTSAAEERNVSTTSEGRVSPFALPAETRLTRTVGMTVAPSMDAVGTGTK
ncbi:unnamed protein product [Pylaiella littoralis]